MRQDDRAQLQQNTALTLKAADDQRRPRPGGCTGRGWVKGQSGNPGGRPPEIKHVRDLARARTEEAIETLVQVMRRGKTDAARVAAAIALLERGWGKPQLPVEHTVAATSGIAFDPAYLSPEDDHAIEMILERTLAATWRRDIAGGSRD